MATTPVCPCCGEKSGATLLFPMCCACANDIPLELRLHTTDILRVQNVALSGPDECTHFVWIKDGLVGAGLYVEADSLCDFARGISTAHWSTVEEIEDIVGNPSVWVHGGPWAGGGEVAC